METDKRDADSEAEEDYEAGAEADAEEPMDVSEAADSASESTSEPGPNIAVLRLRGSCGGQQLHEVGRQFPPQDEPAAVVECVCDVVSIGIQDEIWGERPVLLIVVQDGADEEAIKSSIAAVAKEAVEAGSLSKWAVPDQFRFVAEIAKTSVGKIDKKRLRAEFE